jgi:choline dehydrogenase-like flavoprotein
MNAHSKPAALGTRPERLFDPSDAQHLGGALSCEFVVIGSGSSGATAARMLAEAGRDVIVIEEGPWVPPHRYHHDVWGAFKQLWRDSGQQVARGKSFLPILQGCSVGGTTPINGAIVHRIPEEILAGWQHTNGAGELLTMDALTRVYDQLDDELSVGTAPDAIFGRNNALMEQACQSMGISSNRIRRNVRDCRGSGHCMQGCPTGQKQNMALTYIPAALEAGARLLSQCAVTRVRPAASGRPATVEATWGQPSAQPNRVVVTATKAVVFAASAIQTPLLLQASGIGKRSGLVGRRFQAHPGAGLLGVFDDPVQVWRGATQGYETTHWWHERMKFESVGVPLEVAAGRIPGFGAEFMRRAAGLGHLAQWGAQVRAEAHGRVRRLPFGMKDISYSMTPADIAVLKLGLLRVAELMFEAGARRIYPGIHGLPEEVDSMDGMRALTGLPDDPRLFHGIASHLFGTATLGADPKRSVVSPTLECHDAPGVYVVDASVFPTNMGVNPAHTIAAIAWLAAERMLEL